MCGKNSAQFTWLHQMKGRHLENGLGRHTNKASVRGEPVPVPTFARTRQAALCRTPDRKRSMRMESGGPARTHAMESHSTSKTFASNAWKKSRSSRTPSFHAMIPASMIKDTWAKLYGRGLRKSCQRRDSLRMALTGLTSSKDHLATAGSWPLWRHLRSVDPCLTGSFLRDRTSRIARAAYSITSSEKNEFWSALAEKAYAKLVGSYGRLRGGTGMEALCDLTGGIPEQVVLHPRPKDIWRSIKRAFERRSVMTCSLSSTSSEQPFEEKSDDGILANHEYSITGVVEFRLEGSDELVKLIRIRNPWGDSEYTGPWSDGSPEWNKVSPEKRNELGVTVRDDGEFWMCADYFLDRFKMVDMCHLDPGSTEKYTGESHWEAHSFEGCWLQGVSAGGSSMKDEKFATNPQYLITLDEPDCEDEDGECSVLVSLRQNTQRVSVPQASWKRIGFAIFEVDQPDSRPKPLPLEYLCDNTSVVVVDPERSRDVTKRLRLLPATYCIVPYTKEPDTVGEFVLRIFTEQKNDCRECDDERALQPVKRQRKAAARRTPGLPAYVRRLWNEVKKETSTIDSYSLHVLLKKAYEGEGLLVEFPLEVCRTMVALADKNFTGSLCEEEFTKLYTFIKKCQNAYKKYDRTCVEHLSTYQLRKALNDAECYVNLHVLKALVLRYGMDGKIHFVDFIACAVKVSCMQEIFSQNADGNGNAVFSLNEWMKVTTYC